jgi:hypothetical protein
MQENKSTSARPKETFYQAQHVSRHRSLIRYPAVPNPKISNDDTALRNSGANRWANQSSLANLLVDDIWIQRLATFSDSPISTMMCSYPVFRDAVRRTTVREKEVDCEGEGEVQMVVKIKVCMDILARSAIHSLYLRLRRSVRVGGVYDIVSDEPQFWLGTQNVFQDGGCNLVRPDVLEQILFS